MELLFFWCLFVLGITFTLAIYFDLVNLNTRYLFLFILIAGIGFSVYSLPIDLVDIGWRMPTWTTVGTYSGVTLIGWIAIKYSNIREMVLKRRPGNNKYLGNILFYAIISTPLQELNSRVYPYVIFHYFGWNWILFILFSSAIFAFSHIFLKNKYLTLATFLMSLLWGWVFYFYPDFILLSLSHLLLGLMLLTPKKSTSALGGNAFDMSV